MRHKLFICPMQIQNRWLKLNKAEALNVLHEILDVLKESVLISCVSLDYSGSKNSENFTIKMECNLDDYSRKQIESILDKHNLKIEAKENTVLIYSP